MTNFLPKEKAGFFLSKNRGNNSFAFSPGKKIRVPPVKIGKFSDLKLGNEIVFVDYEDDKLKESVGLKEHLWIFEREVPFFICDNHNRVLEAWSYFKEEKPFLVHIDQHKDEADFGQVLDFEKDLRVCDYLPWAKDQGWIQPSHYSLCESKNFDNFNISDLDGKNFILNLDLDIFAPEQTLISHEKIWELIFQLEKKALLVTVATSPLFLDQERALELLKKFTKD